MIDTLEAKPEDEVLVFTALDRCDACGAQAVTSARKPGVGAPLLFCRHHRRKHELKLLDQGFELTDDMAQFQALGVTE